MKRALVGVLAVLAVSGTLPAAQAQHFESGGGHIVSIGFGDFVPSHLDVLAGDTVTWRNDSVRQHTVTANDESWDSGRLGVGVTFRRRFDQPGPVPYYCRLHAIAASLDVHRVLLDESPEGGGPGRPRALSGRAAAVQGTEVRIEADTGAGFAAAATATVEAYGAFNLEVRPSVTTRYRAVLGSEASPPVTMLVLDRRVSVSARPRGRRTAVSAHVTPASPGASAVLQLRLAHRFGWWPVKRARLNRSSSVRFVIPRGRRHKARVVLTLPDGATITAVSRAFRVGRKLRHEADGGHDGDGHGGHDERPPTGRTDVVGGHEHGPRP
jgi:plastocyanin